MFYSVGLWGFLTNITSSVFILTQSKAIVAVIGVLSVLGFIFGTYAGIYSGILHAYVFG